MFYCYRDIQQMYRIFFSYSAALTNSIHAFLFQYETPKHSHQEAGAADYIALIYTCLIVYTLCD